MSIVSRLYVGSVVHRRLRPVGHRLRYRMFWMLLDLDEIDGLARRLWCFSHNRFNLVSFHDRDHGSGDGEGPRAYVEAALATAGIALDGGAIRLFCMPRILGYGFNPLSVYFCHRRDGGLAAILYEVHNTFGERHAYLIPVAADAGRVLHQKADKCFHVSPFMDMAMSYDFSVAPPAERVMVAIIGGDAAGPIIAAALSGRERGLTDAALLRLLVTHPLLTLKVMAAIHWNALLLWRKGATFRNRPPAPKQPVTVVPPARSATHGV